MNTKMTMHTLTELDQSAATFGTQLGELAVTQRTRNSEGSTTILPSKFRRRALSALLALTAGAIGQSVANAQVRQMNGLTVLNIQNSPANVDFVNAKAMPLPKSTMSPDSTKAMIRALQAAPALGPSGGSAGGNGSGSMSPVFLGTPAAQEAEPTPEDFGTNSHPFTTARADLFGLKTTSVYPYRAAGKLFFNIGTSSFICSASLIKPGIVVTAAHCVANYGQSQFYSGWQFVPGYRNGSAPYGVWTAKSAYVLTKYFNGTDGCAVFGVVCPDDVALIVLNGAPGSTTGWFGYWYGGGFTSSGLFQITQLGYPAGLNNAAFMERNDSYGYTNASQSNNTIIGSNMNGGSSGGPWIENFGLPAALTGETNGSFPQQNVVVGVTSWGYISNAPKEQGAAPFTSGNIGLLVNVACGAFPGNC